MTVPTALPVSTPPPRPVPTRSLPRVLVVEPNPDLQWRIARTLTVRGHRVVGTSTGDGALALVAQWKVDLVLVDQAVPRTGARLIQQLRQQHPSVAAILMVEHQASDPTLPAARCGIIRKPFRPEALTALVDRIASGAPCQPVLED